MLGAQRTNATPLDLAQTSLQAPTSNHTSPKRNQSLDVLRCVAIMLVLGRHVDRYWLWTRVGWIGVDLFFVLSGFLVSGLLFREFQNTGRIDIRRFILRRGFKIWPAFYVYIGVTAILAGLIQAHRARPFPVREFAVTSLFLSNYLPSDSRFFDHIWSLAVEEHFYLMLPLVLLVLVLLSRDKRPFAKIPFIFVLTSFTCLILRVFTQPHGVNYWTTHTRLDSLFAGVMLSYLFHFKPLWFSRFTGHHALVIGFVCCLPAALLEADSRSMQTIGLSALYVGFSFLLAWAVVRSPKTAIGSSIAKAVAGIGFYSYSIYLWHRLLAFVFSTHPSTVAFWLYVVLAVGTGILMSKLIEIPAMRLREKWQLTA